VRPASHTHPVFVPSFSRWTTIFMSYSDSFSAVSRRTEASILRWIPTGLWTTKAFRLVAQAVQEDLGGPRFARGEGPVTRVRSYLVKLRKWNHRDPLEVQRKDWRFFFVTSPFVLCWRRGLPSRPVIVRHLVRQFCVRAAQVLADSFRQGRFLSTFNLTGFGRIIFRIFGRRRVI